MRIQSLLGTISAGGGAQQAPPQAVWSGQVTSFSTITGCWPPATGPTPDTYNVHRLDLEPTPLATGIVPALAPAALANAVKQLFFQDNGLNAGTTYQYWWTAVTGGSESPASPHLTLTTLAGQVSADLTTNPPTFPQAPIEPDTWVQLPVLPTGGTTWTATLGGTIDNGITPTAGTDSPVGNGKKNSGCSLQWALNGCSSGDVIILTAGGTYTSPQASGFKGPALTGPGWLYIVSSQVPELNPGSGATVPRYSWVPGEIDYTLFNISSTLSAGATGLPLSQAWAFRTGYFPIKFLGNTNFETRMGFFQNGNTAVTWLGGMPLQGACTVPQIEVFVGNFVTPFDFAAMPNIVTAQPTNNGIGFSFVSGCSFVRFIGINFGVQQTKQETTQNFGCVSMAQSTDMYFDRCGFGQMAYDWGQPSQTSSNITNGITIKCDRCLVHQCWFYGFYQLAPNPTDAYCLNALQGNCIAVRNCFLEAASEAFFNGGTFQSQAHPPQNMVVESCYGWHPTEWAILPNLPAQNPGVWCKNLMEFKAGNFAVLRNNLIQTAWGGTAGHQHGRSTVALARDNRASNSAVQTITTLNPWINLTDIEIHNNKIYNVNSGFLVDTGDSGAFQYTARLWIHDNVIHSNGTPLFTAESEQFHGVTGHATPDVIVNNNTWILNPASVLASPRGFYATNGGVNGRYDRCVYVNNIVDGPNMITADYPIAGSVGNAALTGGWVNSVFDQILTTGPTTGDTRTYTGVTTYRPGYSAVGFNNFVNNTTSPFPGTSWNLAPTSPQFAVSKAIGSRPAGGPLGAVVGTSLANDPFPRTRWQVIQPSASVYAGATFQANAAKFNIVDFGPFMGIEQQGVNFSTVFQNIKNNSRANGFATPTRCLHYVNSWVSAPVPGQSGGNTSTFTQWEADVNTANWWLRTSYPSGTIIKSTFSGETVNTGVTAITSANTVTFQPTGAASPLTIFQAFWYHYDGALRLGNAVSQGYASNLALVANPFLDGYQIDNVFSKTRVAGSYTMNTTSQAIGDATASALNQQGQALQVAALKAINSNLLIMGNCDFFVHSTSANPPVTTLDPSQQGIFDMVYCQVVVGPGGIDGFVSNSQAMGMLIAAEAQMSPGGTLIFEQTGRGPGAVNWTSATQSAWVAADWQAARFGMAMCFMRNYHYALNANENYSPSSPYFTDETLQQGGRFGWLGMPSDPPQSAARTSGVWWRRFQNGVVFWNPAGNGTQTLTLASLGLSASLKTLTSNGFGDTSINPVIPTTPTTITLQARDGRFLIGAP